MRGRRSLERLGVLASSDLSFSSTPRFYPENLSSPRKPLTLLVILRWFGIAHGTEDNWENWNPPYFKFVQLDLPSETKAKEDEAFELVSEAVPLVLRNAPDAWNHTFPRLATKAEIFLRLRENDRNHRDAELTSAIHRAIRLLFRINIMSGGRAAQVSPDWPDDKTVSEYIHSVFNAGRISSSSAPPCSEPDDSEIAGIQARLTHRLTAVNIEKYTKIQIKETQYLPWHLKLYETYDYTVLYVFRDMRWLLDVAKMENFPLPQ
ncbi:hypothetical protein CcaCcLH18_08453 [Colletotrichum camelliae]|nr:hypothetical protein CcaCcLH18_08453 [Colletotrichum camelliae]